MGGLKRYSTIHLVGQIIVSFVLSGAVTYVILPLEFKTLILPLQSFVLTFWLPKVAKNGNIEVIVKLNVMAASFS